MFPHLLAVIFKLSTLDADGMRGDCQRGRSPGLRLRREATPAPPHSVGHPVQLPTLEEHGDPDCNSTQPMEAGGADTE